ncbi:MAG: STAS domain-containing protein [Rhodanobacter sp.]
MAGKQTSVKAAKSGLRQTAMAVGPEAVISVEPIVLTLPADCRMAAQASLMKTLLNVLDADEIVLDGREVERADTAALQLLTLFQRELGARGGKLSWCGTSDALNEAAALLGLARILEMPVATPA